MIGRLAVAFKGEGVDRIVTQDEGGEHFELSGHKFIQVSDLVVAQVEVN